MPQIADKSIRKKGRSPATNFRGRPPRKAFIKASIANVSADDFPISDDDFLGEDSEDEKPKKKGSRKHDESGSDWEMEHKNKSKFIIKKGFSNSPSQYRFLFQIQHERFP